VRGERKCSRDVTCHDPEVPRVDREQIFLIKEIAEHSQAIHNKEGG